MKQMKLLELYRSSSMRGVTTGLDRQYATDKQCTLTYSDMYKNPELNYDVIQLRTDHTIQYTTSCDEENTPTNTALSLRLYVKRMLVIFIISILS